MLNTRLRQRGGWWCALILALLAGAGLAGAGVALADDATQADDAAQAEVIDRLVEEVRGRSSIMSRKRASDLRAHIGLMFDSPHAVESDPRTPAGQLGAATFCFACHGEGFEHYFNVGEDVSADKVNDTCLQCHSGGDRMHFRGSSHEFQDMACVDCHAMHNDNERLLKSESQLELCSTCHQERRVDFNRPHHHPVGEGQVDCTDCHNPHGTAGPRLLRGNDINQTCYSCHAEHRGPFLWEHQPVREACTNCHDPHGSVHPRMLHARPAQLCQSCHMTSTFHPGELMEHDEPQRRFMAAGRGCLNCHSQVHGSNHPGGSHFRQ